MEYDQEPVSDFLYGTKYQYIFTIIGLYEGSNSEITKPCIYLYTRGTVGKFDDTQ